MILYTPARPPESIPVVDLASAFEPGSAARKHAAWEIHKACRETGFFYVSNHGVSAELVAAQFAWAKRFFDLPLQYKMALDMKNSVSTSGYEPIGGQWLDSQDDTAEAAPTDLKESFYIGMGLPLDHPYVRAERRGFGHNQWPAPLPGFREQMLAYQGAVQELGDRLLELVALSLDLPDEFFAPMFDIPSVTLRLIKYPPHPADARFNQIGAGAHTDWGGITLLAQDDCGGLEVQNVAGHWLEATPIPGAFVVNLGDLMPRWTNGVYTSNMHRVKNNRAPRDRYSVPFFYSPRPDALIECLPSCHDEDRPARFPACTAGEHINEMFRRSYGYAPKA